MPRIGTAASDAGGRAVQLGLRMAPERAHKKRRMIQLGSSPPPFITALQYSKTSEHPSHHEPARRPTRTMSHTNAAPASPRTAARKRKIIAVDRRLNALELRSSSPTLPGSSDLASVTPHMTASQPPHRAASDGSRDSRPRLLQRKPNLGSNDTSSSIGTFGGQVIGHSDRSVGRDRMRSAGSASPLATRTVGLLPRKQAISSRSRSSAKSRLADVAVNENVVPHPSHPPAGHQGRHVAEKQTNNMKRQRSKMQRVQLGGPALPAVADQPFSDADHQLNSQPDAADEQTDESEISYFPTLQPPPLSITVLDGSGPCATDLHVSDVPHRTLATALPPLSSRPRSDLSNVTNQSQDDHGSEEDSSVGLFEVLSQSAMRKIDQVHTIETAAPPQAAKTLRATAARSPELAYEGQQEMHVHFDDSHFTHLQAELTAKAVVTRKVERWTAVDPDTSTKRMPACCSLPSKATKMVQARWKAPSARSVGRQLGLTPAQMLKTPLTELPDFTHSTFGSIDQSNEAEDGDLVPFDHRISHAGYRLTHTNAVTVFPQLEPFRAETFRERMQSRRKEVVKIIIPFSAPSLSSRATPARFVTPNPTADAPIAPPPSSDTSVVLIWMQSSARRFLQALEAMLLQSGSHEQSSYHDLDAGANALYPCPILHYDTHTGLEGKASYIALYLHLDRVVEARRKLAEVELGADDQGGEGYRPFNDPGVRLLVASLKGEALCLI